MLQRRIHYRQQVNLLEQLVATMPEYPIYHEPGGRYMIYVDSHPYFFESEVLAQRGQLLARTAWLRKHSTGSRPFGSL